MEKETILAKKHCASYGKGRDAGVCAGVMIARNGQLWINEDYMGKNCFVEEGCDYFKSIVMPGIPDGETKRR